jgi:hypothetical protein
MQARWAAARVRATISRNGFFAWLRGRIVH